MSTQLIFNFCACLLAVQAGLTVKDINSPNVDQQQSIDVDDGFLGFGIGSAANTVTFNSFNNVGGVGDSFNGGFNGAGNLRRRGSGISAVNSPLINQQQDITANEGLAGGALNTITFNSFNNVAGVSSGVNGGRFNRRGSGIDAVNSPIINQQQDIQAGNGLFDGALNTITFNSFDNVAGISSSLNRRSPQSMSTNNPVINQQQSIGDRDGFGRGFNTLTNNFFNNADGVFSGEGGQKAKRGLTVNGVNSGTVNQQQTLERGFFRRGLTVERINSPDVKQQQNIDFGNGWGFLHRRDTGAEVDSSQEGQEGQEAEQEQSKARRGLSVTDVNSPRVKQQQNLDLGRGFFRRGSGITGVNSPVINQQQHIGARGKALSRRGLTVSGINSGSVSQQQNLQRGWGWGNLW